MANYRFKTAEIEAMKKNILTHIERESETKTAWRLRCAIEGLLMCCRPSKREAARLERELALYEKLTKNDLPNWQGEPTQPATPTETPRISTETAEMVNVSAEGENAKNEPIKHIPEVLKEAEQNYQCVKSETLHTVRETDGKWHTYFMGDEIGIDLAYDQINHIPAARTARAAEEVAEIRRYISRLNGNHIADADYYLAEMREGIKQAEAARRKKNADTEGGKEAERTNVGQNYSDTRVVKDEYHHRYKVTRHWLNGRVEAIEVWDLDHTSEPPQSLEAPPTAKHPTPPPILGRRRRKRARRGAQAAPGLRSAPGMRAGGCGASRPAGRREAPVTSLRGSVGISGMVHGGSFHRGALPRAGPPSPLSAGEGVKVA